MKKTLTIITILFALGSAGARADLITNGSFEDSNKNFVGDANSVDELLSGSSVIPGWTTINGVPTAWIKNGNPYGISASNGMFFLDLTGYSNRGTYGGVSQSFATVPGTNYIVTFDIGYGGASGFFSGPVSITASAAGFSGVFTSAAGDPNPAVWDSETFTFKAGSTSTDLRFIGKSTAGGEYIGLDNVNVVTGPPSPVPEPGTYGLVLTGMGLLGCAARRRLFS